MTRSTRTTGSTTSARRRLVGPAALAGAVLLGGLLAGCSGADAPQDGGASSAGASTAAQPSSSSPSSTAGPSPSGAPTTTIVTSMTTFTSPTGNISCYLAPVLNADPYARCDLVKASWREQEPEGGCGEGDWGGGGQGFGSVGVGGGDAQPLCVGDSIADPSAPELSYGSSITMQPLTCTSADTGMTCKNSSTGHGFTAREADIKLF